MKTNDPFHDEDISRLRTTGSALTLPSGRNIVLPKTFGFCQGVRNAVNLLHQTILQNKGRQIWLLGAMIHNPAVNEQFAQRGVQIIAESDLETAFDTAPADDVFVVPAFGLPLNFERRLRAFVMPPGKIVDATCPFVRRVWQAVSQAAASGAAVIIHGKPGHQETTAIWSRAAAEAAAVAIIPNPDQARQFAAAAGTKDLYASYPAELLFNHDRLANTAWTVVNQTTMLGTDTTAITDILRTAAWHQAPLQIADTLCAATQSRQGAAKALCMRPCDVIFVLGGTNSSNTTQLYRLAAGHADAFFLQSPDDLQASMVRHFNPAAATWEETKGWLSPSCQSIGILAGASCPDSELGNLIRKIARLA